MRAKATDAVVGGSSGRELMHERGKVERNVGTRCKFHGNEGDDGIGTTLDYAVNGTPVEKDHPPRVSDEQEDEPSAVVVEVAPSLGVLEKSDEPVLQPMMPLPPPVSLIVQNEKQTPQPTDDREDKGGKLIGTFDCAVNGTPEEEDHPPNVSDEQEDEPLLMVAEVSPCLDVLAASEQEWLDEPVLQIPVPLHEKQVPPQTDDAEVADLEAMSIASDDGQLGWVDKQLVTVVEELMQTVEVPVEPVDDGSLVSVTASEYYATKTLHFSPVSELEDAFMGFTLQSDRNLRTPSTTHEVHRSLPVLTPSPTNPLPLQLYHNAPLESSGPSQQISAHVKPTTPNNDKIHVTPCKSPEAKISVIPQPQVERGSTACKHRHGTYDLPLGFMAGTLTPTSSPKFALNRTTPSKGSEPKHAPTSSKRKSKKDVLLSSPLKRQKLDNLFGTKSTVWGAGIQLYNGRSVDRISTVKKCANEFCTWEPRIHAQRAACERCWALASMAERSEFIANGRHLRIAIVRGGCPRSCSLFTPEERKNNVGTSHEEAIRLCRRCFSDMHYVGIR